MNAQLKSEFYDFEKDNLGETPSEITSIQGLASLSNYTENNTTATGLEMTEYGSGVNYASASLDKFPTVANYSVTWKQTISFANGSRTGVILKAHGTSRFPTVPQGYLFKVSAHTRSDWQHLEIIRYEPQDAPTGTVNLGKLNLARQETNKPRWYRATVNGANLTFEYSDNGDDKNPTWIKHITAVDYTYKNTTGGTMLLQGFGPPSANTFFDDIEFNELEEFNINNASITINTTDYKQTIDIIGGDMERSAAAVQNTVQNTTDVIQWGFGDIHYNYCRVEYDKKQELVEGVKNWAFYDNARIITMKQIKAINPDIKFWATLRSDYDGYGNENNMPDWIVNYNTKEVNTDKYAIFLADFLEHMEDNGVAIHTLSTVKEWNAYVNGSVSRDIILKLQQECNDRNITMPLINDSASWSMAAGLNFMNQVETLGTKDLYTGFSSHEYASNDIPEKEWPLLVAKATSMGKKMYQDETITGSGDLLGETPPIYRYCQRAILYQSGISGEIMFEIWSRGINKEIRSIYWPNGGTASRLTGHYIAKHFTNNILNSTYITSESKNVLGGEFSASLYTGITKMAFRKGNKIILWVMNASNSNHPENSTDYPTFTINLANDNIIGNIEHKYWNSASSIEVATNIEGTDTTIIPNSSSSFVTNIKEGSINVFMFNVNDDGLSIDEKTTETNFKLYPNPTDNKLFTNEIIHSIKIINLSGSAVHTLSDKTQTINVSNLASGLYLIKALNNKGNIVSTKFIKK